MGLVNHPDECYSLKRIAWTISEGLVHLCTFVSDLHTSRRLIVPTNCYEKRYICVGMLNIALRSRNLLLFINERKLQYLILTTWKRIGGKKWQVKQHF